MYTKKKNSKKKNQKKSKKKKSKKIKKKKIQKNYIFNLKIKIYYKNIMQINDENLDTGDILLFSEKGCCFSNLIKICTKSKFSHVAMVLKNPNYLRPGLEGLYILESTIESSEDAIDHKYKYGVQVHKLSEYLDNYKGSVYIRKLKCERSNDFYKQLKLIYNDVNNVLYDTNPIDWFKASLNIEIGNVHKINTFWCSALVAYIYVRLGLLPPQIPWTIITPADFGENGYLNDKFISSHLENEILILS